MVFKLVISEIHIPDLHGFMEHSSEQIFMNYIVTSIIELDDFYSYDYFTISNLLKVDLLLYIAN